MVELEQWVIIWRRFINKNIECCSGDFTALNRRNQRVFIDDATTGAVDDTHAFFHSRQAGRCSKHNTYMAIPLLFTMISNHFPAATFGRPCGWLILGGLVLAGWAGAYIIREKL